MRPCPGDPSFEGVLEGRLSPGHSLGIISLTCLVSGGFLGRTGQGNTNHRPFRPFRPFCPFRQIKDIGCVPQEGTLQPAWDLGPET